MTGFGGKRRAELASIRAELAQTKDDLVLAEFYLSFFQGGAFSAKELLDRGFELVTTSETVESFVRPARLQKDKRSR